MLGWQIIKHSVEQVWNNRDEALLLTLFPYGILVVISVLLPTQQYDLTPNAGGLPEMPSIGASFGALVGSIITLIVSLWIAVLWHRLMLEGERGTGWIPTWQGPRMMSYFVKGFLIGLIVVGVSVVVSLLFGAVFVFAGPLLALVPIISVGAAAYIFYRLCPVLPAAAVDRKMPFSEAWAATRDQTSTILVLVLLVIAGSLLMQLPAVLFGDPSGTLAVIYSAVVGWFITLIGASILTTFYSHFVEGRPIA